MLYIQKDYWNTFSAKMYPTEPQLLATSKKLIHRLKSISSKNTSLVTIICDQLWLSLMTRMNIVNEVSYFLSLRSEINSNISVQPTVVFPKEDKWTINSAEVMGDFMVTKLERKQP